MALVLKLVVVSDLMQAAVSDLIKLAVFTDRVESLALVELACLIVELVVIQQVKPG